MSKPNMAGTMHEPVKHCSCETGALRSVAFSPEVALLLFYLLLFKRRHRAPHFRRLFVSHSILHTLLPFLKVARDYMNI